MLPSCTAPSLSATSAIATLSATGTPKAPGLSAEIKVSDTDPPTPTICSSWFEVLAA
jgi:hypothetical protein